ncbi:MAG TPA: hypothetical protein VFE86_03570, partial [Ilumatobacteraceae bacterium]|nr:hypothetical protein [Ilumatobacteraceae bacterium]
DPMMNSLVRLGEAVLPEAVTIERDEVGGIERVRLTAARDLMGLATGRFSRLGAHVPLQVDGQPHFLGFAYTQFALPVVAGPALDFDFNPAPNLQSPPVLGILLARVHEQHVLLAPLDHPHEQVIGVADGGLQWGWHGDLDEVPAGFSTTLGIYAGASAADLLDRWGTELRPGRPRVSASANPITSHLSYWTDNGAAYWYRTEAGRTIGTSVAEAVESLRSDGVPIHAVELDSWCYQHEVPRPIAEVGYPEEVPPSGMIRWEPRVDAFDPPSSGLDAIEGFAERLGRPPLVIHSRHISPKSPYVQQGAWWVDRLAAQPIDPTFFGRWFDDARRWGVCAIEQDWMLLFWFGVRALRAGPGRAAEWQRALDALADGSGVDLIWSMSTPADIVLAATLDHVVAVRTRDDYRFADDAALLWTWYLTVNVLAGALGLQAFKDCFFSGWPSAGADAIDGDEHAELEALLGCMSTGPVGIGDRIGCTDTEIVMRTCDADGRIRHVDRPLRLIDSCLFGEPARGERLAWATTTSTHDGKVWTYVVAINTGMERRDITDRVDLVDIGCLGPRAVYDWRLGNVERLESISVTLAPRDWRLWVCAPPRSADFGDLTKYVTVTSELD